MTEVFSDFIKNFKKENGDRPYEQQLNALGYSNPKPLIVDFYDLYNYDEDLARELIENPTFVLQNFKVQCSNRVGVRNLAIATSIRDIATENLGKFIMINGIAVKAGQKTSKITSAAFRCTACEETMLLEQKNQFLKNPKQCASCQSRSGLEIDYTKSEFIDHQVIEAQEPPDQLPPGETPCRLEVVLQGNLTGNVKPGDRVQITGILFVKMSRPGSPKLELTRYLVANHVETDNQNHFLREITPQQIEETKLLAKDPFIMTRLTRSFAPSIYGHHHIKKALVLQQFGSVAIVKPDVRKRGDIHVLLVGDPGCGKSQLLIYAAKLSHRGIYTVGRGSTAAGLTVSVIREKDGGGFTLEVGALVIADTGHCSMDEIEKMRSEDRDAIHPAMEQQIVPVAKGGINTTLNARCSILAAGNPVLGRYNTYQTIAQNISNLPITLLSRFDLIFIMRDNPDEEKDAATSDVVLDIATDTSNLLSLEQLKNYIAVSKTIKPLLTQEVAEHLKEYYVTVRQASVEGGEASAVSITVRQLESLIRLTKAHARAHLREEATLEDADVAIDLFTESMHQVGIDPETGQMDIDMVELGKPRSMQAKLGVVLKVVSAIERIEGAAEEDQVKTVLLEDHGIGNAEARKLIGVCHRDGTIYSPRPGFLKRT